MNNRLSEEERYARYKALVDQRYEELQREEANKIDEQRTFIRFSWQVFFLLLALALAVGSMFLPKNKPLEHLQGGDITQAIERGEYYP